VNGSIDCSAYRGEADIPTAGGGCSGRAALAAAPRLPSLVASLSCPELLNVKCSIVKVRWGSVSKVDYHCSNALSGGLEHVLFAQPLIEV
jgi:hypothetical protein